MRRLISYLLSNTSVKNHCNQIVYVKIMYTVELQAK